MSRFHRHNDTEVAQQSNNNGWGTAAKIAGGLVTLTAAAAGTSWGVGYGLTKGIDHGVNGIWGEDEDKQPRRRQ